jgi:acyl carrier protein
MAGPTATLRIQDVEVELKKLIVDSLRLEGTTPAEINSDAALVGDGLGLDSIDILELSMAIHKAYGIKIEAEDASQREIFASVRSLATFVVESRAKAPFKSPEVSA